MKFKKNLPNPPPNDPESKFDRFINQLSSSLRRLTSFLLKDLINFVFVIAIFILIIQLLLIGLGLTNFSWKQVGITLFIIFILKTTNWKGLL